MENRITLLILAVTLLLPPEMAEARNTKWSQTPEREQAQIDLVSTSDELERVLRDLARKQERLRGAMAHYRNKIVGEHPAVVAGRGSNSVSPRGGATVASFLAVKADTIIEFSTLSIPVSGEIRRDPDFSAGSEGGRLAKRDIGAVTSRIREFARNVDAIVKPEGDIAELAAQADDWDSPSDDDFQRVCGRNRTPGACFATFFEQASVRSAKNLVASEGGATPQPETSARPAAPRSAYLFNRFFPLVLSLVTNLNAGERDESASFLKSRMMDSGLKFLAALVHQEPPEGLENRQFETRYSRIRASLQNGGHDRGDYDLLPGATRATGYYRRAAQAFYDVVPISQQITREGLAYVESLIRDEGLAADKAEALRRQVETLKEKLAQPQPEIPVEGADGGAIANSNGAGNGTPGGGNGGSSGEAGGGAGGAKGGGKGPESPQSGEGVTFEKAGFASIPEASGLDLGLDDLRDKAPKVREALPPYAFTMPEIKFPALFAASTVPWRVRPLGLGSKRGNGDSDFSLGNPNAGNLIGVTEVRSANEPNGSNNGGAAPSTKGNGESSGLDTLSANRDGQDGGDIFYNFMRLTGFATGGSVEEGTAVGSSPNTDSGDSLAPNGLLNFVRNGSGRAVEGDEGNPRQRFSGFGIMANVGSFAKFCGQYRGVSVPLCGTARDRRSSFRAGGYRN